MAKKTEIKDEALERAFEFLKSQEREAVLGSFPGQEPTALPSYVGMLWNFGHQGAITNLDFAGLMSFMGGHFMNLLNEWQFIMVNDAVHALMKDGVPSMDEVNRVLIPLFVKATGPAPDLSESSEEPSVGLAFDSRPDSIAGMNIVLSGEFKSGKKNDISTFFSLLKAKVSNGPVTKLTDAVLVGSKGSKCWSHGSYGNKIDKALELRKKGFHVLLLKEEDFF